MRGALTDSDSGIMAIAATVSGLAVVERYDDRLPHVGGMAGIAQFTGHRVGGGLVGPAADTIMATGAVARLPRDGAVVKQDLQPVRSVMTAVTGLRGGNVGGALAGGDAAVMTAFASRGGLRMTKGQYKASPAGTGGMARLAHIRGLRMCGRFVGGVRPGMTHRTGRRGLVVRKRRD